nr:uncharacterized protein LOC129431646 [Misgurnus anguillicaudatus]
MPGFPCGLKAIADITPKTTAGARGHDGSTSKGSLTSSPTTAFASGTLGFPERLDISAVTLAFSLSPQMTAGTQRHSESVSNGSLTSALTTALGRYGSLHSSVSRRSRCLSLSPQMSADHRFEGGGLTMAGYAMRQLDSGFLGGAGGQNPLGELVGLQRGENVTPAHRVERCPFLETRWSIENWTGAPFRRDLGAADLLRLKLCDDQKTQVR